MLPWWRPPQGTCSWSCTGRGCDLYAGLRVWECSSSQWTQLITCMRQMGLLTSSASGRGSLVSSKQGCGKGFLIIFPWPLPDDKVLATAHSLACNSPGKSFIWSSSFLSSSPYPWLSRRQVSCGSFPYTSGIAMLHTFLAWLPLNQSTNLGFNSVIQMSQCSQVGVRNYSFQAQ